jgi:hypothetical protein
MLIVSISAMFNINILIELNVNISTMLIVSISPMFNVNILIVLNVNISTPSRANILHRSV